VQNNIRAKPTWQTHALSVESALGQENSSMGNISSYFANKLLYKDEFSPEITSMSPHTKKEHKALSVNGASSSLRFGRATSYDEKFKSDVQGETQQDKLNDDAPRRQIELNFTEQELKKGLCFLTFCVK
jgi:hypothetical protein